MRKIFAGALIFSVIGAVILGGTLAWSNSKTLGPYQITVGSLSWDVSFSPANSGMAGPNGAENLAGTGIVTNLGDYEIGLVGGTVIIKNVDVGHAACDANNFSGRFVNVWGDAIPITSTVDDAFQVLFKVGETAPQSCIGATVTYDLRVTVTTGGNGPEPWSA